MFVCGLTDSTLARLLVTNAEALAAYRLLNNVKSRSLDLYSQVVSRRISEAGRQVLNRVAMEGLASLGAMTHIIAVLSHAMRECMTEERLAARAGTGRNRLTIRIRARNAKVCYKCTLNEYVSTPLLR
jgi:hypothetical protein